MKKHDEAQKQNRKRRSQENWLPTLEKNRDLYENWAYAGNEATMRKVFREKRFSPDYFNKIPPETFTDVNTIKTYGEQLRQFREQGRYTLQQVEKKLGIKVQALSKIEAGERKKINRDFLVLFCGFYNEFPEKLLGLSNLVNPIAFEDDEVMRKSMYISYRLEYRAYDLFRYFASAVNLSPQRQKQLFLFLSNTNRIQILSPDKIHDIVYHYDFNQFPDGFAECEDKNRNHMMDINNLDDLSRKAPELLDVFVSIAAMENSEWNDVCCLLRLAGFL